MKKKGNCVQVVPEEEKSQLNMSIANQDIPLKNSQFPNNTNIKALSIFDTKYKKYLYYFGECLGTCFAIIPCFQRLSYLIIRQGQQGVKLTFGRYVETISPGLQYFNPCTDRIMIVNCMTRCLNCQKQQVVTKDLLMIVIDADAYFRVIDIKKSLFNVHNVDQAIEKLVLATMKNVAGAYEFQELLEKRSEVQEYIRNFVDEIVDNWGIDIERIVIKDIQLNPSITEAFEIVSKEQRVAQGKVIQAQANVETARLIKNASEFLESKPATQIRYLQTANFVGQQIETRVVIM